MAQVALVALTVASTVATVAGSIAQGQAAQAAANANADMLRRNAALEEQQGQQAYLLQQRKNQIARGKTLAALSGNGIAVDEASPLDLLSEQAKTGEFEAENQKFVHDQRAWQMRMGAVQQQTAGDAAMSTATGKAIAGGLGGLAKIGGNIDFGLDGVSNAGAPAGGYTIDNLRASGLPGATVEA